MGRLEKSKEIKLEVILSDYLLTDVIFAMNNAHPYEAVAYDIFNSPKIIQIADLVWLENYQKRWMK